MEFLELSFILLCFSGATGRNVPEGASGGALGNRFWPPTIPGKKVGQTGGAQEPLGVQEGEEGVPTSLEG